MRNKIHFLTAAIAAIFCFCAFPVAAYAGGGEDIPEETAVTEATEETVAETKSNPFTPDGTGTVLDNATDSDGKEFFTITTEAGNIFYLIIDRQRNSDNVYFLNAVTEADLMALAEKSEGTGISGSAAASTNTPEAAPEPTPEPEATETGTEAKSGGGNGGLIFILIAALAAGGAGWYFKIYKPKQQATDPDEDFEDEYEDYEDGFDGDTSDDDEAYESYSPDDGGDDSDDGAGRTDDTEEE